MVTLQLHGVSMTERSVGNDYLWYLESHDTTQFQHKIFDEAICTDIFEIKLVGYGHKCQQNKGLYAGPQ